MTMPNHGQVLAYLQRVAQRSHSLDEIVIDHMPREHVGNTDYRFQLTGVISRVLHDLMTSGQVVRDHDGEYGLSETELADLLAETA